MTETVIGGSSLGHDARNQAASAYLAARRWRVGRRVGRNVYAVTGNEPSDDDVIIGQFDTAELAATAVRAHNEGA